MALREVRECLESLGEMLAKVDAANTGRVEHFDFSALSDENLWALEALLARAGVNEALGSTAGRQPYKPELLQAESLARIAKGD